MYPPPYVFIFIWSCAPLGVEQLICLSSMATGVTLRVVDTEGGALDGHGLRVVGTAQPGR